MDAFQSLDIVIFCVVSLLLIINIIGYWFGLKTNEMSEHFEKCPSLQCDITLVNSRIKNTYIMIQYLEDCLKEITSNISLENLQSQIEPYEDIYLDLTSIENKIRIISDRQSNIIKVWNSIKNTKYLFNSKKLTNIDCFQIKSVDECNGAPLKSVLKMLASKLEEISYQTGLYNYYIEEIEKMMANYNIERKKTIKESSAKASSLMSSVLGTPVQIDLSKNLNSPPDPAIMKAAKTGNISDLAKMALANPDIIKQTSNIDTGKAINNSANMFNKNGPNAGGSFATGGNNLLSSGMDQSKDPQKAQEKYKAGQKKIKLPPGFI